MSADMPICIVSQQEGFGKSENGFVHECFEQI